MHVEVSLPDETGRVEIFGIHTKSLRDNKALGHDVNLDVGELLLLVNVNYSLTNIIALNFELTYPGFGSSVVLTVTDPG